MTVTLIPYLALLPYAAVAGCLLATLLLFLSLKAEVQRAARRERQRVEERLARLEEAARPPEPVIVPVPAWTDLQLNRRAQIQRMLRRGDEPASIAAALAVPVQEVELLQRVQRFAAAAVQT